MTERDDGRVPYAVFTTEFDQVVTAHELAARPSNAGPAARDDDKREGILPSAETDAAAIAGGLPAFDGTVQILLDMSGSNRGVHIETIRIVDVTARALEKAGIPFEVLGYTTASWKGGQSRDKWKIPPHDARVSSPGRLCDLLHVVFKETDRSWDDTSDGLPSPASLLDVLFRPPYLKENVDGEALRWARSRHPGGEVRMIVFNDGSSIDDSTLSTNPPGMLTDDRDRALAELAADGIEPTVVEVIHTTREPSPTVTLGFRSNENPAAVSEAILSHTLAPSPGAAPGR